MLKYLERLQEEDVEVLKKKRDTQHKLMEEVAKCNDVSCMAYYNYGIPLSLFKHKNCVCVCVCVCV